MATSRTNYHSIDTWVTVGVTPLGAGWRNICQFGDGLAIAEPCAVVFLQELRKTWQGWDQSFPSGVREMEYEDQHEPPFDTRVVFATRGDAGSAEVVVFDEMTERPDWYLGTIGPGEDIPQWMHDRAKAMKRPPESVAAS